MEQTLADIAVGQKAKIIGFEKGSQQYRQKLLAMGLIKGTEFEVARVAPLGDPVEIVVRDYSLSLRKEEAKALVVGRVQK
ncbi:ferrous iron transport protein A [Desulfobulbus rhabdoformis]|uniref:FeoA family protein n=1 Tax=Desulfobulbus rhabdoformis TaxID=34032 RepID=UPI001966C621|nr:FeoA family protein [Desulfobulbus rhabdoformis]MBM9614957.1 ferrous iron transport protein A [Desulfobulbus rhabdoformis]